MKDISKLSEYVDKFTNKVIENVTKAQQETAQKVWEDVVDNAPYKDGDYIASIRVSDTTKKGNTISTEIFTEAQVMTKSGNSYNLGLLLETGTNPHAIPNAFGWGDKYGYDSVQYKKTLNPNWHPGTIAQPHFKPALEKNKSLYKENIKRAIKEAEEE